jgi:hypothetical protein
MPIHGQCPGCGRKFQAPDRLSGQRVKCPNCAAVIHLDHAQQQATVPQAPSRQKDAMAPSPSSQPGVEKTPWYVSTAAGEQLGPMSKARLDGLVAEGRLDGFCRVRREDWQDWKWAEAVYPQFALLVQPEGPGQDQQPPAGSGARLAAADADRRLRSCPDCDKLVSRRASRCPHCGCPLATPDDPAAATEAAGRQTDESSSVAASSPAKSGGIRSQVGLLVAGAVSGVLLISIVAGVVGWQLWRRANRALDNAVESLAVELTAQEQPPQNRKGEETTRKAATPEEMQQYMQEAAAAAAKQVDELYRKVHLAKSLLERTEQSADLLRSLAEGDLEAAPKTKTKPAPAAKTEDQSYQSQYKPLYDECLAYIRQNIAAGELDCAKVRDLADGWMAGKRAALEAQLEEQLQKQLGL